MFLGCHHTCARPAAGDSGAKTMRSAITSLGADMKEAMSGLGALLQTPVQPPPQKMPAWKSQLIKFLSAEKDDVNKQILRKALYSSNRDYWDIIEMFVDNTKQGVMKYEDMLTELREMQAME
jgi:hypothetical protein